MEAIIFIGIQASGKSTFYKERFFKTHVRINLDMLKTRSREKILIEACIKASQPFVIDNTNPTTEDRKRYMEALKNAGFRVSAYCFQSSIGEAIARNNQRSGNENVPVAAIRATHAKLQLPNVEEGFDALYYVKHDNEGGFIVEEWKDEVSSILKE